MKTNTREFLKVLIGTAFFSGMAAHTEVVRNPTHFGANIDAGQIIAGEIWKKGESQGRADGQMLTRTGVYMTESGTINDKLGIFVTFGGLFWIPLPEENDNPQDRRVLFGAGFGQAQAVYSFGDDPKEPAATLRFGLFPHKYSESSNLGEYLFRSGTYPGYLVTGGWSYLNSAAYLAQGLRLTVPLFNGIVTNDFTVYMERDIEPARDLSPGYMLTIKPASFAELRFGGVYAHGIAFQPKSVLTPNKNDNATNNAYSISTGLPIKDEPVPSLCTEQISNSVPGTPDCGYYTFQGVKVIAGGSLDFGTMLGSESILPGDFMLYAEMALLGVKDYPHYYNKKSERMPLLVGARVPTLGLLDRLSFEMEYRKSRFPNTIGSVYQNQRPLPIGSEESPTLYTTAKTSYKWSVLASRQIIEGVKVHAQVSNDHMRHFASLFADPHHLPATVDNTDWQYIMRLEFGI